MSGLKMVMFHCELPERPTIDDVVQFVLADVATNAACGPEARAAAAATLHGLFPREQREKPMSVLRIEYTEEGK